MTDWATVSQEENYMRKKSCQMTTKVLVEPSLAEYMHMFWFQYSEVM
jgi:hypothetical protein